jgi:hypothetical protein
MYLEVAAGQARVLPEKQRALAKRHATVMETAKVMVSGTDL